MTLDTFEYEATTMFHNVVTCQFCPGVATMRVVARCCKWHRVVCDGCWRRAERKYQHGCTCKKCGEWFESLSATTRTVPL